MSGSHERSRPGRKGKSTSARGRKDARKTARSRCDQGVREKKNRARQALCRGQFPAACQILTLNKHPTPGNHAEDSYIAVLFHSPSRSWNNQDIFPPHLKSGHRALPALSMPAITSHMQRGTTRHPPLPLDQPLTFGPSRLGNSTKAWPCLQRSYGYYAAQCRQSVARRRSDSRCRRRVVIRDEPGRAASCLC